MSKIIRQAIDAFLKRYPIATGEVVGVAVSGGADSLCLALALADVGRNNGFSVHAVTVDHQLRAESADEALYVGRVMQQAGILHDILVWKGDKPHSRIEEQAREKRYELMISWCQKKGISRLFTAHHAGDQAETFWARLARGSGVDGLSAMSEVRQQSGIQICRPFLSVSKQDLKQALLQRDISWVEDSMNADASYERVRWRQRQPTLSDMGLSETVVVRTARRLKRAKAALDFYADRFYSALVDVLPEGFIVIHRASFEALPDEIQIRVIQRALLQIGGDKQISLDALERCVLSQSSKETLGGCLILRSKENVFVTREAGRMSLPTKIQPFQITEWDHFWVLSACPVQVQSGIPMGDSNLPYAVRCAVPSVSADDKIKVYFCRPSEKELEKMKSLDYKKGTIYPVYIWMKECEEGKK